MDSDNGSQYISWIIQHVAQVLNITWKLHTSWRLQARGLVERINGILKKHLAKICQETDLKWPDTLPMALKWIRALPQVRLCSPYEIVFGHPWPITGIPMTPQGGRKLGEEKFCKYLESFFAVLSYIHRYVVDARPLHLDVPAHEIQPGDWVLIKTWKNELLQPQ